MRRKSLSRDVTKVIKTIVELKEKHSIANDDNIDTALHWLEQARINAIVDEGMEYDWSAEGTI